MGAEPEPILSDSAQNLHGQTSVRNELRHLIRDIFIISMEEVYNYNSRLWVKLPGKPLQIRRSMIWSLNDPFKPKISTLNRFYKDNKTL